MSDEVRVACPHCGSRFRLKSRQSLGRKITCRNCSDEFTAREAEDDEYAAAELPPAPARRSSGSARRKKADRFRISRWVFVAAALVLVAGLGIAFSGPLSRFFGQIGGLGDTFNPLTDSPQKVLNDLMALRREIGDAARSVHDERSRDAAIRKFNSMHATADEILVRASRLDTLTDVQIRALVEPLAKEFTEEMFADLNRRVEQKGAAPPGAAMMATPEFQTALADIQLTYSRTSDSLLQGLKALPEPKTDGERVERDAAEQYRRIVRLLARISSAGDRDAAASEVAGSAATMKDIAYRATEVPPGEVPKLDQRIFDDALHHARKQCDVLMHLLENRYGKHSGLEQQIGQFKNELTNLEMTFSKARGAAYEQAAHDKAEKDHAAFRRLHGLDGQPATAHGGSTAGTPGGIGGLPSSPQAMRDDFLKLHGPDGVLTVTAMKYPGDKLSELSRQLREVTGANQIFAFAENDRTYVYVAYAGDVKEIASRIDFCKLTAVDAKKRTITIEPRASASGKKNK